MSRTKLNEQGAVAEQLRRLVGAWEGRGRGRFPTIDPFEYRELYRVWFRDPAEPTLHYEQETWRVAAGDDNGEKLHWESGFLMAREDGRVDLLNSQESGRIEVLVGDLFVDSADSGVAELMLESVLLGHDERMVQSARTLRFGERELSYEVRMATARVAEIQKHLDARLTRRRDRPLSGD